MSGELLKLKITMPPLQPRVLQRPRLLELLNTELMSNGGFHRKLTLVTAPAGFGKTSIVRQWLTAHSDRVAWYSLDETDSDPSQFWLYFLSALGKVAPVGESLRQLLSTPTLSQTGIDQDKLIALLNELANLEAPLFLALDDFHFMEDQTVSDNLAFLIERLPPTMHIVVITRSDPDWPLARWLAKRQLVTLGQSQLRFSDQETAALFTELLATPLGEQELTALNRRTEGWITGLQLLATSLRPGQDNASFITKFTDSDRHILDYLTAEVLHQLSTPVQEFLLQTSILPWLHPELCNAVSGRPDSAQLLEHLASNNLFLSTAAGPWYRYHSLFRQMLQVQLKERQPEHVPRLHQRAATWLAENKYFGEALRHFLAADDQEQAALLLNSHPQTIWRDLGLTQLTNILEALPPDMLTRFPRLGAYRALGALVQGRLRELPELLDAVQGNTDDEVSGMLAVIRTYLAIFENDPENIRTWAKEAIVNLPPEQMLWRSFASLAAGDGHALSGQLHKAADFYSEAIYLGKQSNLPFSVLLSGWKLGWLRWQQGQLHDCQQLCAELQDYIQQQQLDKLPRAGAILALQALVARERGELELAAAKIATALATCRAEKPIFAWCLYCQVLISYSSQQPTQVREALAKLETIHREQGLPGFLAFQAQIWRGRLALDNQDFASVTEVLDTCNIKLENPPTILTEDGYLLLAHLALARGETKTAEHVLNQILALAGASRRKGVQIEALLLKTRAAGLTGEDKLALDHLSQALETASGENYCQPFWDAGGEIIRLLPRIPPQSGGAAFASRLLQTPHTPDVQPQGDLLSSRELEILTLMDQGLSNQEIGHHLYLSVGTVKWHATNIYSKLQVKRRAEALARARELKLINH